MNIFFSHTEGLEPKCLAPGHRSDAGPAPPCMHQHPTRSVPLFPTISAWNCGQCPSRTPHTGTVPRRPSHVRATKLPSTPTKRNRDLRLPAWPTDVHRGGVCRPLAAAREPRRRLSSISRRTAACNTRSSSETSRRNICNISLKQIKHLKHALEICVCSHCNMCNIKIYF
jgi:hypothetical protein